MSEKTRFIKMVELLVDSKAEFSVFYREDVSIITYDGFEYSYDWKDGEFLNKKSVTPDQFVDFVIYGIKFERKKLVNKSINENFLYYSEIHGYYIVSDKVTEEDVVIEVPNFYFKGKYVNYLMMEKKTLNKIKTSKEEIL